MTTVWKFTLPLGDVVTIEMPVGAVPLCVQMQDEHPQVWARVDPTAPKELRRFRFAGTGHPLADNVGRHVGSFQMAGGALVFHVFEVTP